jgi:hypothetical protein
MKGEIMPLTGKQIADAVIASARSSGYFKPYDASSNWHDFYDRVAAKLATETTVSDDFNVISDRILTTWPKALQQQLYNALYIAGCRIYKS